MKVLIVDDENLVRRSLRRALEQRGHVVSEAEDGLMGVELWQSFAPDLVYLDVLMPKLTGPAVLTRIGKQNSTKVILMSAFAGEYDLAKVQSMGADLFIPKPFENIFAVVDRGEELVRA
jgi:DNA-binding response OmpR family regulator